MTDELTIPLCLSEDFRLIFTCGEYDIPMSEPPKSVLDIGGNVGLFSIWASRIWPDAKITAYEPWQENAEMFRRNAQDYRNVSLVDKAVRAEAGTSRMFNNAYSPLHSFSIRENCSTGTRDVECIDAASVPSAEFVKIDAEGSEWEIIQRLDLNETNYLAIEAHSRIDATNVIGFLTRRGFAVHNLYPSGTNCLLMKFIRRSKLPTEKKLFVAVPTYGGSSVSDFWKCLLRLQARPPCNLQVRILDGDSLVSRARNTLTAEFLNSDCTHLLFLDSDLIFSSEHISRIMEHDAPVVAGFYPKKQDGHLAWVCNGKRGEKPNDHGLQEVRYMGTGFLRIAREVFLAMIERWGDQISYHPDHAPAQTEYDLWPVGVYQYPDGHRRYLSEDWYFCQRWLDLGGKVYGDCRIVLKHVGRATYPLKHQMAQITEPIEAGNQSDSK